MAVFFMGEVFAGIGKRGTAAMETVGVVNPFAAGLRNSMLIKGVGDVAEEKAYCFTIPTYPSRYYYTGQA